MSDNYLDSFFSCARMIDPRYNLPGTKKNYLPDRAFSTRHIKLELELDIPKKKAVGVCHTTVEMLNNGKPLAFDAEEMKILSVKIDGKAVAFDHEKGLVTLKPAGELKGEHVVSIAYEIANPRIGIYFINPDKHYPKKQQEAWSHSQPQDAHFWFPCQDVPEVKATFELLITVDKNLYALSNGDLVDVSEKHGKKTFHWKTAFPNSIYLNSFAVGDYSEIKDKWNNVSVLYYAPKGKEKHIVRAFSKTPKMIEVFSRKIGVPYQFSKYAQVTVQDFVAGGMEHTTATTQTDVALQDELAKKELPEWPEDLCAHELAHQWFGDLVTCKEWAHAWLNESFATYFEEVFNEEDKGRDFMLFNMYKNAQTYFAEEKTGYRRPIVTNEYVTPKDIFDRHLYEKGSCVLHMLRRELGEELFWEAIKLYVEIHKNASAVTQSLVYSIRHATGRNMQSFFDQWIYKAGHPDLKVNTYWDPAKKEVSLSVFQRQPVADDVPLFQFPLTFECIVAGKSVRFNETIEKKEHHFTYKLMGEPQDIRVDPDNDILKKLELAKPLSMWRHQLENGQWMVQRIFAAQELGKAASDEAVSILSKSLLKEKAFQVQVEIALALGATKTDAAFNALVSSLPKVHLRGQRAILEALGEFKRKETVDILLAYAQKKDSYLLPSEAYRSLGKMKRPELLSKMKTGLARDAWLNLIQMGAVDGIAQLQTSESYKILLEETRYGKQERSRMAALRNLAQVGKFRQETLDAMIAAAKDHNELVAVTAVSSLGDLGDERALPFLKDVSEGKYASRLKRAALEAIRKIKIVDGEPSEDLMKQNEQLRKELEEVKKQTSSRRYVERVMKP